MKATVNQMTANPALEDPRLVGIDHKVVRHGRVDSLEEAARLRGVAPGAVIKTMVLRVDKGDFVFVLVPGDRVIAWPKLRGLLGVNRISLPDADTAFQATGYLRGTITPLGSSKQWAVIADERMSEGTVSIGGGEYGVSISLQGADLIEALGATVADVTKAAPTDRDAKSVGR